MASKIALGWNRRGLWLDVFQFAYLLTCLFAHQSVQLFSSFYSSHWIQGRCQVFRARGSRSSSCRFSAATSTPSPSSTPESSNLHESYGSSCWKL